jgi:hypothetical protein
MVTTSARSGRPKQRAVAAEILLSTRWIAGTLPVPETQSLTDFLNTSGAFVKLTDASVPGLERAAEFLALQRSAVSLVAPTVPEERVETEGGAGITSPWRIACVFEQGILYGRLDFLVNLRLSDYLRQQAGFLVVRDGVWASAAGAEGAPMPSGGHWPVVLVNPARALGVVEGDNPPGAGHPGRLAATEWGG